MHDADEIEGFLPLPASVMHIVVALADGEKHGYAIMKEIETRTDGRVRLSTGTLYGIIKRQLEYGWIRQSAAGSTDRRGLPPIAIQRWESEGGALPAGYDGRPTVL